MVSASSAMSVANFMWRAQGTLHGKNNLIVPGSLLSMSVALVVYCHMTQEGGSPYEADPLKTFLCMIVVQILPLVALELKIMSCADPVGVFCKFAVPVTLIHVIFLTARLLHYESYNGMDVVCTIGSLMGALFTMVKGFHWSPTALFHHKSVWGLMALCALGASLTQWLEHWWQWGLTTEEISDQWKEMMETMNAYMEILAFVPAVWMVFCEDKNSARVEVDSMDTKRTSTAFFLFLVGFYVTEDLLNAYAAWEMSPPASFAHCAHFALLVDFSFYVLAHIYNPEKLMGELRKWLPVDVYHEV